MNHNDCFKNPNKYNKYCNKRFYRLFVHLFIFNISLELDKFCKHFQKRCKFLERCKIKVIFQTLTCTDKNFIIKYIALTNREHPSFKSFLYEFMSHKLGLVINYASSFMSHI